MRKMNDNSYDLPPEFCHYPDEGCEFSESCLNCPLPVCIYDEPRGKHRLLRKKRVNEMTQLYAKDGKSIRELARIYKVSRRTVQRTLKVAFGENGIYSTTEE
ncbi:MAG: helix-turn-helix domain-containing protein [Dehalococcoidales bacterium]